jgi:(p)ppGpp synthase/HD superfamily hydrolase
VNSIQKALKIAFECHKGQRRKGNNSPYIVHILDVAKLLLFEPSASENVVIAGILHDVLEDTNYNADQMKEDFGPSVLELVQFVTEPDKDSTTSKEEKRRTWKQRKQHTLEACQTTTNDQILVLLADKLSNLQSLKDDLLILGDDIWSCFNAPKADICWYYHELSKIFGQKISNSRLFKLYDKVLMDVFPD